MDNIFDEADKVYECWQKDLKKLPAQINIIDLLHCNENAHSRILAELLKYDNGKFRKSFLEIVGINEDISGATIELEYPANIKNKAGRIDILIYKKNKYAIIIENKGNGAEEQDEQISRYVLYLKDDDKEKYAKESIYCLYLTQEGGVPSENSLHDDEAKILNFDRNKNIYDQKESRLKPINYKYDILNWLRKEVLPNIIYKDKNLIDGVSHYIDYLETKYMLKQYIFDSTFDYFKDKKDSDIIDRLFDASILKQEIETKIKNFFKNFGMKNFSLDKDNYSNKNGGTILIYRDNSVYDKESRFSLGWTASYNTIFGDGDGTNKFYCPHKLLKLSEIIEKLQNNKENLKTSDSDNDFKNLGDLTNVDLYDKLDIYIKVLEIVFRERLKLDSSIKLQIIQSETGCDIIISNNDGPEKSVLIYKKDSKYSLGWYAEDNDSIQIEKDPTKNKYGCPHKLYDKLEDLLKDLAEIFKN